MYRHHFDINIFEGAKRNSGGLAPNSSPLAMAFLSTHTLCVPASSASVERIFSASRLIMRPQRTRLSSEMLEILVYIKCNCIFFENEKIDTTWHYRFIFKRAKNCRFRSQSWSQLLLVSILNQRSRKATNLGLGIIIKSWSRSWSRSRWYRLQHCFICEMH